MPGMKPRLRGPFHFRASAYVEKTRIDSVFRQKLAMYQRALLLRQSVTIAEHHTTSNRTRP